MLTSISLKLCSLQKNCFPKFYSVRPKRAKTGIMMLNMGGPQTVNDVYNFLLRIFSDNEIIKLPVQSFLARYIAKRRSPKIVKQYMEIGGGSPITQWTQFQGDRLVQHLDSISPETAPHKLYIGFRYVHPLIETVINEIENDKLERVVAFSQYPQFSCTTSGSSFNAIARHYRVDNNSFTGVESIKAPSVENGSPGPIWSFIDRWPVNPSFIETFANNIRKTLDAIEDPEERHRVVLLFSAHSIPVSVVDRGDPYPQEVAATVHAVMKLLDFKWPYRLVWQSKVGPAAWLGPSTEEAIAGLARLGHVHAMLIPIAFTSDHIETLYEMDIEYCTQLAKKVGMVRVHRAPALNGNEQFIRGLADLVAKHLRSGELCTRQYWLRCPLCTNDSCGLTRKFLSDEKEKLSQWTSSLSPNAVDQSVGKSATSG